MIVTAQAGIRGVQPLDLRQEIARAGTRAGLAVDGTTVGWEELHEGLDRFLSTVRLRGVSRLAATQLRAEIRALAWAARAAALRPEQFVSLVKESWSALPEVRAAVDPLRTSDLLSGIITICIHEFYGD